MKSDGTNGAPGVDDLIDALSRVTSSASYLAQCEGAADPNWQHLTVEVKAQGHRAIELAAGVAPAVAAAAGTELRQWLFRFTRAVDGVMGPVRTGTFKGDWTGERLDAVREIIRDLRLRPGGKKASKKSDVSGDWSNPMSKTDMRVRLGNLSERKFATFVKAHPLRKAGNRQLWQIRLDQMDAATRGKFE